MRWIIAMVLVMVVAAAALPAAWGKAAARDAEQVPVLLYHHLEPTVSESNGAVIAVSDFDWQMRWLAENGYVAVTTAELADWLAGERELPVRSVLITFDDGYQSGFDHAYPILVRYKLKAAIFVVTASIERSTGVFPKLTWAQLSEMERSGVIEVQSHSHDGHHQVGGQPALLAWSQDQTTADATRARATFAARGLRQPVAYAYPNGAHSGKVIAALETARFRLAFTVSEGYVRQGDAPYTLRRQVIYPGISECRFAEIVTGAPAQSCVGVAR